MRFVENEYLDVINKMHRGSHANMYGSKSIMCVTSVVVVKFQDKDGLFF
jgi:hypothetical protein